MPRRHLSHIQSADTHLLQVILLAAQRCVGVDLDLDVTVGLFVDLVGKLSHSLVDQVLLVGIVAQLQGQALHALCRSTSTGISGGTGFAAATGSQSASCRQNSRHTDKLTTIDLFHTWFPPEKYFSSSVFSICSPVRFRRNIPEMIISASSSPESWAARCPSNPNYAWHPV